MRRALRARDQGCRFPGCTHQYFIDGHHIEHWSDGDETGLANLVLLCRQHHRLVHEGGFSCEKTAGNRIEFRDPRGELIGKTGTVPPVPMDTGIAERLRHRYEDLHIDALTAVTRYDGEGIDWDMAIEGLLH